MIQHSTSRSFATTAFSGSRRAFTIFELLIVLSLVVVIASLSWPSLMRYVQQANVQTNAEEVRQQLDQGRVSAIEEGLTYQFRFEPNGRKFVLLPFDLITMPDDSSASTNVNDEQTELALVYELAEGCRFYVPSSLDGTIIVTEQLGEQWLKLLSNGSFISDTVWSTPILFYADGSSTEGLITVMDDKRRYVSLFVRGLTGTVSTSKVEFLPESFGG